MRTLADELRSRRVLIKEFMHSAKVAENNQHLETLSEDLAEVEIFLEEWNDNPTPELELRIREWMGWE